MITIFILIIVFHILVIVGIVPYNMVWGGKIERKQDMLVFEATSIAFNLFFILILLLDKGVISFIHSKKIGYIGIWIMAILFALNTVGNLFAENNLETLIFTPITLILCLLSISLIVTKGN